MIQIKNFEEYDKYENMENDIQHAFRLPRQLREDFNKAVAITNGNAAKTLRRLMIDFIVSQTKDKNK